MEDGATETEIESLVFPKNSSPREEKNYRQERDESKGGEDQRANGLITHLDSGRSEEEKNQREKVSSVSDGKEEETVGGMINNIISNWVVFPSSPKVGEPNKGKVDIVVVKEKEKIDSGGFKSENDLGGSGGGGGIISDLIGNVFHQNESQENEEETVQGLEGNGQALKAEDEGGGGGGGGRGGGITDNIVSHLPASLADGVAPLETDEASILIHSVVHD